MSTPRRPRALCVSLFLAAALSLGGCGSAEERPDDRGTPAATPATRASTATPSDGSSSGPTGTGSSPISSPTPARAGNPPGVQCLAVPQAVLDLVLGRPRDGHVLEAGQAFAQLSDTRDGQYFVSVQVEVSPPSGTDAGSSVQLAVWVVDARAWAGGGGSVLSADEDAARLTTWPAARDSALHVDPDDPDVGGAAACQLV